MKLEGQFWFSHQGRRLAGQDRIELLACIAETGSISKAAKAAGMSYKTAWDAVDAMNSSSDQPLVERAAGGRGGGGTRLTAGRSVAENVQCGCRCITRSSSPWSWPKVRRRPISLSN